MFVQVKKLCDKDSLCIYLVIFIDLIITYNLLEPKNTSKGRTVVLMSIQVDTTSLNRHTTEYANIYLMFRFIVHKSLVKQRQIKL